MYVMIYTIFTAPSAAPTSVGVSEVTSSSITVQWEAVPCIEQNGDITGYTVRVLESGEMERVEDVGDDVTQVTISDLTPSTTYSIQVAAVNSEGTGPYNDLITIDTPDSELYYRLISIIMLLACKFFCFCTLGLFQSQQCYSSSDCTGGTLPADDAKDCCCDDGYSYSSDGISCTTCKGIGSDE